MTALDWRLEQVSLRAQSRHVYVIVSYQGSQEAPWDSQSWQNPTDGNLTLAIQGQDGLDWLFCSSLVRLKSGRQLGWAFI